MIYDNLFLVNIDQLIIQLLPVRWRHPIHIALLKVFAHPFKKQLEQLKTQRALNIYTLTHDSRVGSLQKVLNDKFDFVNRRITIGPGNRISALYLYKESEARQTYLRNIIYTQTEIADRTTDFIVNVPVALNLIASDLKVLEFLTAYYSEKDKQFKIQIT